ncbi:MAG: PAS-domain containing protein [Zoogloeaceae bacterium]|uniref:PAS-domain containing protein n=1 Tax=Denitromonas sp. TaxID=2734609 RepID=UPI001D66BDDB|nr:PAS-domain containing protein [Rhodocyclaceae bacterium]MCP5223174.1 PAS-domain containing protein [Zoogloeaceae bacterium]
MTVLVLAVVVLALGLVALGWAAARRQELNALRAKCAQYEAVLNHLPAGVTLVDASLNVTLHNAALLELMDLPADLFARGSISLEALVRYNAQRGEYGAGPVDAAVEGVMAPVREPQPYRYERTRPNGSVLAVHGAPLPDGGFVTIYTDVTERHKAEAALARESFDLQTILDHLPQGISVFDDQLRMRRWNRVLLEVLELPASAVYEGVPFEDLIMFPALRGEYGPGDPAELVKARKALALQFKAHRFERTRPNGRTHLVEGTPMVRDGKTVGFVASYTDISDRKQAEGVLQAKHDVLQTLVDNIPSGVTVFDADLNMVLHNDEVLKLVDFPKTLAVRQPHFSEVIRYNAEHGEYGEVDVEAMVTRMVKLAEHPTHHAIERVRPDGTVLEVRGVPLPGGGFVSVYTDVTERRQMELALKRRSAYLQAVLAQLPQGISVFDEQLRLKHWNDKFIDVLELPEAAVFSDVPFEDLIRVPATRGEYGPGDPETYVQARREQALRFEHHRFTRSRPNGRTHLVEGQPMTIDGAVVGFITTYTDITDHMQVEQELRTRNEVFRTLIDNIPGGVSLFDGDFNLLAANEKFHQLLDFPDWLMAKTPVTLESLFRYNALRGEYGPCNVEEKVQEKMARAALRVPHMFERTRPNGTVLEIRGLPLPGEGFITIYTDVTEHKRAMEAVERLAHQDALTGLDNRYTLESRLDQSIADARRSGSKLALLFIDMDNFKAINDSLGHAVGDKFLIAIARRLRKNARESDIVARPGGDEFVLAITNIQAVSAAVRVVTGLFESLAEPLMLEGQQVTPSASVGIAVFPDDGDDRVTLMKHADIAMYSAKDAGRNGYRFFDAAMTQAADERLRMEADLRRALKGGEFVLHFQPKIESATRRLLGFEALIRWQQADGSLIPPVRFIPLAEETGLIGAIGEWALHTACQTLRRWRDEGLCNLSMSVNVSARQLRNPDLPQQVQRALENSGVPSARLEMEITESVAMEDPERTVETLRALKAIGIGVSIDDFGTGYSSLAYLKLLPINCLKLDRTFVTDIETDPNDAAICAATIRLAHTLGLSVVAEGVETAEQARYLDSLDCDVMQGYYFSRPLPEAQARAFIIHGVTGGEPAI